VPLHPQNLGKDTLDVPLVSSFSDANNGQETVQETLDSEGVDVLLLQATDVLSCTDDNGNSRELRELVEKLVDKIKVLVSTIIRSQRSLYIVDPVLEPLFPLRRRLYLVFKNLKLNSKRHSP
jgi:hypothetical protein